MPGSRGAQPRTRPLPASACSRARPDRRVTGLRPVRSVSRPRRTIRATGSGRLAAGGGDPVSGDGGRATGDGNRDRGPGSPGDSGERAAAPGPDGSTAGVRAADCRREDRWLLWFSLAFRPWSATLDIHGPEHAGCGGRARVREYQGRHVPTGRRFPKAVRLLPAGATVPLTSTGPSRIVSSPVARRPSPVARRPSPVARRPSPGPASRRITRSS
jgi:hypothetical protein